MESPVIDAQMRKTFPPHYVRASDASALWWDYPVDPSQRPNVMARFAIRKDDDSGWLPALIFAEPNDYGSFVHADDTGVYLHLGPEDKMALAGRATLFAVLVDAVTESALTGQLVVSDWAARPHGGTA